MSEQLTLSLLGRVQAELGGEPLDLLGQKSLGLLAYLATTGQPHTRETLSDLLWGESTDQRAKASLRTALWQLGQTLESFLIIDRQTVAFDKTAPHWVDFVEFEKIIERTVPRTERRIEIRVDLTTELSTQTPLGEEQALRLAEAVSYYRGDFLAGFQIAHAPAFDDWVLRQREWAHRLAIQALYHLVDYYLAQRAYRTGLDTVTRLLVLAPWQEEAHRQRMLLLALSGQRNAALAQYETCRSILAEELDVEPTIETQLLYQRIKAGKPLGQEESRSIVSIHATSPYLYAFLNASGLTGRESEIAELKRVLTDPTVRTVILGGPAGAGKTHLALTVASQIAKLFDQGIGFVPMLPEDGRNSSQTIESDLSVTLARVLGLTFSVGLPRVTQILDYLRYKNLLLILDDFVPSPSRMQLVQHIQRYNRNVKLLIISDASLDIEPDQTMYLSGLDFPDPATLAQGLRQSPEGLMAFGCMNLFADQAQSLSGDAELTDRDLRYMSEICRSVAGLPLGIKLIAPWIETIPLEQIADQLGHRIGSRWGQGDKDIDSESIIETLLTYIWNHLDSTEQESLSKLATLTGSFSQRAAEEILDASPGTLRSLIRKGLLESVAPKRYSWHPLLRRLIPKLVQKSRRLSTDPDTFS